MSPGQSRWIVCQLGRLDCLACRFRNARIRRAEFDLPIFIGVLAGNDDGDLDPVLDAGHPHRLADELVLDLVDGIDDLLLRVAHVDLLIEALIENPDLAAMAVEAIDPDWLESTTARMMLSAYQDLDLAGRNLDCDTLLLLIENEQLKKNLK